MTGERESGYVRLGRIGSPYGVKGWVKLLSFTDPLDNILDYRHFRIDEGGHWRDLEIDESRPHGKTFVAHIKGCDDRDQTRHYTGKELWVAKADLPALDSGDYYWYQLEGLRVLTLSGEDLGIVDHLMETGANDVLVVRGSAASVDDEERLIPYVQDQVVREVNLEQGFIRVAWEADY